MKLMLMTATVFAAALGAQAQPPQQRQAVIARSDLADAQLRFEKAYAAHPPGDADRARIHKTYDHAILSYYGVDQGEALRELNHLTDSLDGPQGPPHQALVRSLQVRIAPEVARSGRPSLLRLRVGRLYPVPMDAPVELRLVIRSDAAQPQTILDEPVKLAPDGPPFSLARAQPKAHNGRYMIELVGPDGTRYPCGQWLVTAVPLDSLRVTNERRLSSILANTAPLTQALVACRARNMLLSDQRDENLPASFLADPVSLGADVQAEVLSLQQGQNPYIHRPGDTWRVFPSGGMEIPARVYAPANVQPDKPMPLVFALHDLGGDENTFMQFIANGRLKQFADEHGLLLVAPNLNWVMRNPSVSFESIIEALSAIYPVDSSRVCVMGHGSGAMTAVRIAAQQPSKVAKLVLFAGADFTGVNRLPPTLLYSGQLDPLFNGALAQATMEQARALRLPVEHRDRKDSGHHLLVHDALSDAVQWMIR
jgi:predicted esterase